MAITFKALITTASFDEDTKKEILEREKTLTSDQKMRLSRLAWDLLRQEYEMDLNEQIDKEFAQIDKGNAQYDKERFIELQDELTSALMKRIHSADDSGAIEEVREQIQDEIGSAVPPSPATKRSEKSDDTTKQYNESSTASVHQVSAAQQQAPSSTPEQEAKQKEEALTKQAIDQARRELLQIQ